ncbi:MAG: putative Ig domain-containing protein [Archangium sp.]|nr:putative Ig domain-containing protein [Archangium sp.]
MKKFRLLLLVLATLPTGLAWAQYTATPQAGIPYPALTNAQPVPLVAPGANDPKDRGRVNLPFGFVFPFYNKVYSQLTVTANGLLFLEPSSAANTSSDFSGNIAIPSGAEPNGLIAPLWDDLFGSNPTSIVQTEAVTGPFGQGLAIEFKDWNRAFGNFLLNFQVRLWANGMIEFFYGTMTGAGATPVTATIGIESPSGTAGTRGLTTCTADCSLTSFDPGGTGTPISYIRFGPPAGVDLQALTLRVDGITQAGSDLSIGTTVTMRNFGTLPSGTFGYGVYLSQDTIFDGSDLELLPAPVGPFSLPALGVTSDTHTGTVARPDGGSWYVIAAIPPLPDGGETNVFNNVIASSVPYAGGVDLIAESVAPPPVAGPGDVVNLQVAFSNQGFEPAGSVGVKLFASVDTFMSADDRLLTTQNLSVLGGQQVVQPVSFTLAGSTPADDYFILMELDDGPAGGLIPERSELNNVVASVTQMQVRQADLTVTAVRVLRAAAPYDELSSVFFGEATRFEAFVSNTGGATAPNVRVSFFMSDNESLNAVTDVVVGNVQSLVFAPGESRWVTLPSANIPTLSAVGQPLTVQPYFFFAAATGVGLVEENPGNNFEKSRPTVARAPAPNLLPVEMQTPLRAGAGELVVVSRTLTNLGNRDSAAAAYRFYLSANPIITPDDQPLMRVTPGGDVLDGTVTLAIAERDSAVEIVRLPQTLASAQYFIGVLLDPDGLIAEADESDNGLAGTRTDVVTQSLTIATPVLPDATLGLPYSVQLVGQGSAGPFTFSLSDPDSLPGGLTVSTAGLVSGTPTEPGAFSVYFKVEANGRSVTVARPLRVARLTTSLELSARALPAPTRFVAYRAELGAVGGTGGYRYLVINGILPVGLVLADTGAISGTPTDPLGTTRVFTVRVTDSIGNVDERAFAVTVVDAAPFTIQTRTLPDGLMGAEYIQSLFAVNPSGAPVSQPVTWKLITGELPSGLVLEPSQSDTLVISGTPSRPGRFRFTIEAVDGQGRTDAYTYFVFIASGSITSSVTGTGLVRPGEAVAVAFSATPVPPGVKWFWREGRLPPGVVANEDGTVTGTVPADAPVGVYTFTLGVGLAPDQLLSMASWSIEVNPEKTTKGSCSASGGSLLGIAALLLLARRRAVSLSLRQRGEGRGEGPGEGDPSTPLGTNGAR